MPGRARAMNRPGTAYGCRRPSSRRWCRTAPDRGKALPRRSARSGCGQCRLVHGLVAYGLPPGTLKRIENDDVPNFLGAKKMIEKGFTTLELGRTAKEAKANIGAAPKQIYNYISIKNRIANMALQLILKRFNSEENDKEINRNPFK